MAHAARGSGDELSNIDRGDVSTVGNSQIINDEDDNSGITGIISKDKGPQKNPLGRLFNNFGN